MNSFETAQNNLLSLSKANRDYDVAVTEWDYHGDFHDNVVSSASCELCGQQNIRYEFQIVNRHNRNTLLVGSECITKFGITVYDDYGNRITGKSARARVASDKRKLVANAKTDSVINSLLTLASRDPIFEIQDFIRYYQERGAFTPKQLSLLMWRLNHFKVPHNKSHFKLTIRRDIEKRALLRLEEFKLVQIRPCMTAAQLDWLAKNGR
jgi:hypothetical protein